MTSFKSRQFKRLLVAFVACVVGAGSFLAAAPALADTALFRVQRSFHNFPNPALTTPGNAGKYTAYILPYASTSMGAYNYAAATATVEYDNPIGGAFDLPQSFFAYTGTFSITPDTGWLGYTTITYSAYYNGPGHFEPNQPDGFTMTDRLVFPTTGNNPYPNYAKGNPVTPTTTWGGQYDFDRAGSINVEPGPNRFGGTFRVFYQPEAFWYQYVALFAPAYYKGYADFACLRNGGICTPGNFVSVAGDVTTLYRLERFLLNACTGSNASKVCTGTGMQIQSNSARATTSVMASESNTTVNGTHSYIIAVNQYMNINHPWTTGFASVHNPVGSPNVITPQAEGYDIDLYGQDITLVRRDYNQMLNETLNELTTTTETYTQNLFGVGRIVSMVRPRMIHTYSVPLDLVNFPIENVWNVARLANLKVFFVPEPTAMLMMGAGIAGMLGLSRIRRR